MNNILHLNLSPGINGNEIFKLVVAVVIGCILGFEREYRGKSAGLRTLALICLGSTIFTICSYRLGVEANRDRIAANIITGVGFIGAGVILRNNASISGITTAASIWITASIGMLIGIGDYMFSFISVFLALTILYVLDFIQFWIDNQFQHRTYKVVSREGCEIDRFNEQLKLYKLKLYKIKTSRLDVQTSIELEVAGKAVNLELFNKWLMENQSVLSFDW